MQMWTLEAEVRRSIMRVLNASEEPVSTVELAEELGCTRKTMVYQLGVLAEYRLVTKLPGKSEGGTQTFSWLSTAKTDHNVTGRLEAMADGDALELKTRKQRRKEETRAAA
jgi:DNA-binding HxlR family transcriptional regulator